MLWGRPDGVILILAILVSLVWQRRWRTIATVLLVAGLTFAPWVLFTEIYYGSVVPHTIVAKRIGLLRLFMNEPTWSAWAECWAVTIWRRAAFLRLWLSPIHGGTGNAVNFIRGARPLQAVYFVVLCVGLFRLLRREDARVIGVFAAGFAAYVLFGAAAPGLLVPDALGGRGGPAVCLRDRLDPWSGASSAAKVRRGVSRGWLSRPLRFCARCLRLSGRAADPDRRRGRLPGRGWCAGRRARGPERLDRLRVSRLLRRLFESRDLDFPGLCSPRTVAAMRQIPEQERTLTARSIMSVPSGLRRGRFELERLRREHPDAASLYVEAARFHADPERVKKLGECLWLDGFDLIVDNEFVVLRRQDVKPKDPEPR